MDITLKATFPYSENRPWSMAKKLLEQLFPLIWVNYNDLTATSLES